MPFPGALMPEFEDAAPALGAALPFDDTGDMPPEMAEQIEQIQETAAALQQLEQWAQLPNVADEIEPETLSGLGSRAVEEYRLDRESRSEWEDNARRTLKDVVQKPETKNYPFENASNVRAPLLASGCLQFAARAYPAIVEGETIIKTIIIGGDKDDSLKQRAGRIATFMSWQLRHMMTEWEEDTDTLLHQLPALGCAFRKVSWDRSRKRPRSEMISALDLVVHQNTTHLDACPRISQRFELYPHEIKNRLRSGVFSGLEDADISGVSATDTDPSGKQPIEPGRDSQAPQEFIEQHRYEDLDGDGFGEPWIVTVHLASEKVVRLQANYDLDKAAIENGQITLLPRFDFFVKYGFIPDPRGSFYDLGYGELLRSLTDAISTNINQMIDAAHLQNAGGGFIGAGINLKKSQLRFSPGVYHTLNVPGQQIKEAIVTVDHPGPSPVSAQAIELFDKWARELIGVNDTTLGDIQRMQPAATTLAQIEQSLKVFSSIYKRLFRALGREYSLLYRLNGRYPNDEKYLRILNYRPSAPAGMNGGAPMMPGAAPGFPPSAPGMAPPGQSLPGGAPMPPGLGMPPGAPMPGGLPMPPMSAPPPSMQQDFAEDESHVVPAADPTMVTEMQSMLRAQFLMELGAHPVFGPLLNKMGALKRILGIVFPQADDLLAEPDPSVMEAMEMEKADKVAEIDKKKASAERDRAQAMKIESEIVESGFNMTSKAHTDAQETALAIKQAGEGQLAEAKAREMGQRHADRSHALAVADHHHTALTEARAHERELLKLEHEARKTESAGAKTPAE